MRILYTTDLHGVCWKFKRVEELAAELRPDVVVNGGDITANMGGVREAEKFLVDYLDAHLSCFDELRIPFLFILGNDDYRVLDRAADDLCSMHPFGFNIAQRMVTIQDYDFIGFNWVVDYPFRLKDRCRMDTKHYVFQEQLGTGLLSERHGWTEIPDWPKYAASLPTIEDELHDLIRPSDTGKTVYVVHMPPAFVGLDRCSHGAEVGSVAVHDFLERNQPLLSFHGHIHESPEMTGVWKAQIGRTLCVQPGQRKGLTYVMADLNGPIAERYIEHGNKSI